MSVSPSACVQLLAHKPAKTKRTRQPTHPLVNHSGTPLSQQYPCSLTDRFSELSRLFPPSLGRRAVMLRGHPPSALEHKTRTCPPFRHHYPSSHPAIKQQYKDLTFLTSTDHHYGITTTSLYSGNTQARFTFHPLAPALRFVRPRLPVTEQN